MAANLQNLHVPDSKGFKLKRCVLITICNRKKTIKRPNEKFANHLIAKLQHPDFRF